jgi:hypothetical protein
MAYNNTVIRVLIAYNNIVIHVLMIYNKTVIKVHMTSAIQSFMFL